MVLKQHEVSIQTLKKSKTKHQLNDLLKNVHFNLCEHHNHTHKIVWIWISLKTCVSMPTTDEFKLCIVHHLFTHIVFKRFSLLEMFTNTKRAMTFPSCFPHTDCPDTSYSYSPAVIADMRYVMAVRSLMSALGSWMITHSQLPSITLSNDLQYDVMT